MPRVDRSFDAVLFDLDGTLLDTLEDLGDSMNAVLGQRGHPLHPIEAYRFYVGDGIAKLVWRALPEDARDEATVMAAVEEMRTAYTARWKYKSRPYDGVGAMLGVLAHSDLRLVIYSNKPEVFTQLCVEELLDPTFFEIIRGALEGVPVKPDPTAALAIARQMGLPPKRFLYLGDTDTDMKTACSAGMFPVGVSWGFRSREELRAAGAELVIDSPQELLEALGLNALP